MAGFFYWMSPSLPPILVRFGALWMLGWQALVLGEIRLDRACISGVGAASHRRPHTQQASCGERPLHAAHADQTLIGHGWAKLDPVNGSRPSTAYRRLWVALTFINWLNGSAPLIFMLNALNGSSPLTLTPQGLRI